MGLRRLPNRQYRSREHLTPNEAHRLIEAAGQRGRYPLRDRALLLLMYRHGLRVGEATRLRWDAVMWEEPAIAIQRLKNSVDGIHPLQLDEVALLRQLHQGQGSTFLFMGERGGPLTTGAIAQILRRSAQLAQLSIQVHPHMLRHSCGYALAEQGLPTRDIQDYLGHRNIQNTVRYTAGNPARFQRITWTLQSEAPLHP